MEETLKAMKYIFWFAKGGFETKKEEEQQKNDEQG